MRPGPSPKPTKLKRLAGNPGKRPLNDGEPQFRVPQRMLRAPDYLDEDGQAVWREMGKMLLDAGLFTVVDRYALGMWCASTARWQLSERMIRETGGPVIESSEGNLVQNPWLWTANAAWEQMRKMFGEFGLTPAERSRLRVAVVEQEDDIADVLVRMAMEG